MKAIIQKEYGEVDKLTLKEIEKPLISKNQIIKKGKLTTLIDKVYDFHHYKEAHEHVYSKHKIGNVLIKI